MVVEQSDRLTWHLFLSFPIPKSVFVAGIGKKK